ncbi:hypothetical protein BH20ACT6_BH20ACT6_24230 [soil metagenome]
MPDQSLALNVGKSFQTALDGFFGFLPKLLGFLIILLIGYIVAKVVATVVSKLLEKVGVDRHLQNSDANQYVERVLPGASASSAIAKVVFWIIFIFFLFTAIGTLEIPALTTFMNDVLAYLPNIIVAIVIFIIAATISGAIAAGVAKLMGDTPTGKIVASVLPALIMVIAMFMILEQLNIAPEIVRIAFAATIGAIALGLALAFGLGGRPVAQRMLEDAYEAGQRNKEQMKADVAAGRQRGEQQAQQAQASVQTSMADDSVQDDSVSYDTSTFSASEPDYTSGSTQYGTSTDDPYQR